MCHSLYVKANGEMPCWDDAGEELILRTLDEERLLHGAESNIFYSPELQRIRGSFIAGIEPYPEVCRRCAVKGHGGGHTTVRPPIMDILHLEASYLCQLSCPQCIPAADRRLLKAPPYHLSVRFLQGLLTQLQKDGVRHINVVHFEGRGDPLMNGDMGQLIAVAKAFYSSAVVMVTTHGSYSYKPWIVESGLDVLRVSIDGAFSNSYAKYRIGGRLERVFRLLATVRDEKRRLRKRLHVEWKYILFEWNDSDSEIAHALHLADELEVQLRFVLTHSPGRSKRFQTESELQTALARLAPTAKTETTFPLREPSQDRAVGAIRLADMNSLFSRAIHAVRDGDEKAASAHLRIILEQDPGISVPPHLTLLPSLLRYSAPAVLARAKEAGTLSGLAVLARECGEPALSRQLVRRQLALTTLADLRAGRIRSSCGHAVHWVRVSCAVRTRMKNLSHLVRELLSPLPIKREARPSHEQDR